MKKIIFLIIPAFLIFNSCVSQNGKSYNHLITEARSLYAAGDFENSGETYSQAFTLGVDSLSHRYDAARAWAKAGQKDLAFTQLFEITNNGKYNDLGKISSDRDFNSLTTDERWMTILNKVSENKKEAVAHLSNIASILETVHGNDQNYRQQLEDIEEKYGHDSEEIQAHWELIRTQDSVNLIKVKKILDEYGWLGWDVIGRRANRALFLVIQHSDIETQGKYLPMLREAVKKGDAASGDLALLEDRVALRQGRKQIYGSQIKRDQKTGEYYVSPLHDPDNVNKRRAAVGLNPIEDYISYWGLTWDVEAYKQKWEEMEKEEGN